MEQELEAAILAMTSPQDNLKQKALLYCEDVKHSPNGWEVCLKMASSKRPAEIRFFCLQVVEHMLRTRYSQLDAGNKQNLRKVLFDLLLLHMMEPLPYYLKNKLFVCLVLVFKNEYLVSWPSFFDDLLALVPNHADNGLESFLQICIVIDDEVVSKLYQRDCEEKAKNTLLKDAMRDKDVPKLISAWHQVFLNYQSNAVLENLVLQLYGLYVVWIDIQLILNDSIITRIYECLSIPNIREEACSCMAAIIGKGMSPSDKLQLIRGLGIIEFVAQIQSNDIEFEESVAKLVNSIGLELCTIIDDKSFNHPDQIFILIEQLFPSVLKYLANEYDDTTLALFPFLSQYFLVQKRFSRMTDYKVPVQQLVQLLEVLAMKLKYDINEEYNIGKDAGEEEALFADIRKNLRIHLESVASIDAELFSSTISGVVCRVFDSILEQGFSKIPWVEVELVLHLLFIYSEALPSKGPIVFVKNDGQYTPLGVMVRKCIESGVSNYPHPSIPNIYFEIVFRYASFFEKCQDLVPNVLQSFLDARGLFNAEKSIRLRVDYLFSRFVKVLRSILGPFVESILSALESLLVVKTPAVQTLEDLSLPTEFDSQLFLFEAVGYLISIDAIAEQRQCEILSIILTPMISRMEEALNVLGNGIQLHLVAELGNLISAIGAICKGFPDFEIGRDVKNRKGWTQLFMNSLQAITIVLTRLNSFKNIRESAKFALQRMTGSLGPELLEVLPMMLGSGLLSSESCGELAVFLPFIGLNIHKFGKDMHPILTSIWNPLREKIGHFQALPPAGTDDEMNYINLRKAELTLVASIFNAQLDDILCTGENLNSLNQLLTMVIDSLKPFWDPQTVKLGIAVLSKMIYCWGGSAAVTDIRIMTKERGAKGGESAAFGPKVKDQLKRRPLEGFDSFIFQSILPAVFCVPTDANFSLRDGQSIMILTEISLFNVTMYAVFREQYCNFLANNYLPSLQCPPELIGGFVTALESSDKKQMKQFINVYFA